jgi:Arm DNA-binding domain
MVVDCVSSSPRQVRSSGSGAIDSMVRKKICIFGEYPRVTLKDARELHFAARKLLGTGINPVADRKAEVETKQMAVKAEQRQADNSFEKIACGWWSWWSFDKSPRHAETILRRLETDVFPAYGHKPNDVVTVTDIRKLMLAVQAEVQET